MIFIVDFGSQVTQLIARRVREAGVYCEIVSSKSLYKQILNRGCSGIVFSGGPASVHKSNTPKVDKRIFNLNIPILGICYGMQLLCYQLGGKVKISKKREFGKTLIKPSKKSVLFLGFRKEISSNYVWMSHGDKVISLPRGFKSIASSSNTKFAAVENKKKSYYGLQFHPEVYHTTNGLKLLNNFLLISGFSKNWSMGSFKEEKINDLKNQIGNKKVICALSGGVDSSVTAALIHKAIGNKLTCIYVDHGFCLLYTSPSPRDVEESRMPYSA